MFTLRSSRCIITEQEPIPKLCLSGKAPPRNAAVELTRIDVPANMSQWPAFHNGAAAGLRLRLTNPGAASDWVVFNRPGPQQQQQPAAASGASQAGAQQTPAAAVAQHGGFLMAMGLNGHLKHLERLNLHDYLAQAQEMITVGVLLGVGADYCG